MGSINEVHLYAPDTHEINSLCESAISTVVHLEKKYSRYKPDTIVSQINANAGKKRVAIDPETTSLLGYADTCFKKSSGLFDITAGVLRNLWDFKDAVIPTDSQISKIKKCIGWSRVSLNKEGVLLPHEGMEIDLGGIVKEYASDRAAAVLRERNVANALINLGGDIHIIGPHPSGKPWAIGIAHPRKTGLTLASIALTHGALATSGDYERFFEVNGKRYCHILNPKTGWPVHELQSVTVCADSCLIAGSLSTITMLMGKKKGLKLLKESGVLYLVIDNEGAVYAEGPFQIFDPTGR